MSLGRPKKIVAVITVAIVAVTWLNYGPRTPAAWSESDLRVLQSLSLTDLPALPPDPSNAVGNNPRAASFGHQLFFDTRFSTNGMVSCATCHQPERRFTDGLPKGRGIALSGRNTRSIVGTAYSPWLYWDGRKDSQWSQALAPLEDPAEHGSNRMTIVRLIASDPSYRSQYEALFSSLPDFSDTTRFPEAASPSDNPKLNTAWNTISGADQFLINRVFSNVGKAIAAYERQLMPGESRFDRYVNTLLNGTEQQSEAILTAEEILGLQLFIDKARCTECHNGPLFTNNEFHNTGILSFPGELPDRGRISGLKEVLNDPFNCAGPYSDDPTPSCPELVYVRSGIELIGATRTPSLRNLGGTAPYSHKGQQETLAEVLSLYNRSPLAMIGHNEAENPLGLSRRELRQLEAFLISLDAPLATQQKWLRAP